ncbi:glucosamine 6-phosphate synthetase [bacterium]|nr:glucosamine 6-phosphate synthetase [bacterium]
MCGIFGYIASPSSLIQEEDLNLLVKASQQRGRDSSGLISYDSEYKTNKADYNIEALVREIKPYRSPIIVGHSRLVTNGMLDNQPVVLGNIAAIHNGIIVNDSDIWREISNEKSLQIDSEVIVAIAEEHLATGGAVEDVAEKILSLCKGVVACALVLPAYGKLILFSNNGSLYYGKKNNDTYFASEFYPLKTLSCDNITKIKECVIFDIPVSKNRFVVKESLSSRQDLVPQLDFSRSDESLLEYFKPELKRCTKCVLPETMPFISFDSLGVCNYCHNYKRRNVPKPKEQLFDLVKPYRKDGLDDCIVPFSGGRDSCFGLHLIVRELKMKPITYTYDWGMVTDLGRRNISRMCAELGVENIIIADDISKKRKNIAMNLNAWLKSPHLGMISILTAGDKHFFRHVETVKKQTGINLNLWGVNPLEVTHFKTGFLGIEPDFAGKKVYSDGALKQLRYQSKRLKAMSKSLGYFNRSLWDTLSGEYHRSFTKKEDYYHLFDYWRWDEKVIEDTLDSYDWERSPDTRTTWRIGDGTAGFYNYIYYSVAGFTEHDTFRSNQIREGDITREEALDLLEEENTPRYPNIKWYLDAVGIDFSKAISIVNSIPKLYNQ